LATVTMPQLGETVTEGTVGRWLKKEGEAIAKYEPLLEVETDKVASEIPSPFAGTLTKIIAPEGTTVPVGAPVCEISETAAASSGQAPAAPASSRGAQPVMSGAASERTQLSPQAVEDEKGGEDGARFSPAVRKLAREYNVDLNQVPGSGRGGRVTANDVIQFAESGPTKSAPAAPAPTPVSPPSAPAQKLAPTISADGDTSVRVTQMRKTIAEHMLLSKTTVPHAWSMVEADVTELVRWREREKESFKAREGINLTFLPIVILAVCGALREFPMVNATWAGDKIIVHRHLNIGIAVEIEEGLVVPVLRDADQMSLSGIARRISELVAKARSRKLTMEEMSEGTFTVDNTGALGSVASYPIINSPQAGIITMEAIVKRPWVINDAIAIRSIMNLCMSLDHRVLDGSVASRFLQSVKRRLENFVP
jgi:2-oxoisovalerate dehydrogenase E2 component (dihydrolipoyl transacylase)